MCALDYANEFHGGKKGGLVANHSTGIEKCQIAFTSSLEKDKRTLLTDTPSPDHPLRH